MQRLIFISLIVVLVLLACSVTVTTIPTSPTNTPKPSTIFLADLKPHSTYVINWKISSGTFPQTEGSMVKDETIHSLGKYYFHAIFAHAPAVLVYTLDETPQTLTADILIQDSAYCSDGAEFRVYLDEKEIYSSGILYAISQPKHISLDLTGGHELMLFTDPGIKNNSGCDWTIWADPILTPNNNQVTENQPTAQYLDLILETTANVPIPDEVLVQSAVEQYVNAMKMAGINLDITKIINELQFIQIKGANGSQFVVGKIYLDPDSSKTGESLEGYYPILIAHQKNSIWVWKEASLRDFADILEIDFGTSAVSWKLYDPNYTKKIIANNANSIIMDGETSWNVVLGEKNDTSEMIHQTIRELDSGKMPNLSFDFDVADKLVDFAKNHGMKVQANHIFVPWYIPEEIVSDLATGKITYEQFDRFLEFYTKSLVGHFKGRIDEYSVVNEVPAHILYASEPLRSVVKNLLKKGTLQHIFEWANEADPNAILIFNDCIPRLGQGENANSSLLKEYIRILRLLLSNGTPINRAGMQGHVSIYVPSTIEQIDKSFKAILGTGVSKIGFTEVTVSISPNDPFMQLSASPWEYAKSIENPYTIQAQVFKDMFESSYSLNGTFLMFGITDAVSWDSDPDRTPEAKSLIMDENYQPKPAYYALMQVMFEKVESKQKE